MYSPSCGNVTLRTGRVMPLVGFGTYQLRGEDCIRGVEIALSAGYRHIDTASVYRNGKEIRAAIAQAGIPRDKLFITSKIGPKQQGYEEALAACQSILEQLNTTYLDLLLIHWPGAAPLQPEDPTNSTIRLNTWKALVELQQTGKVRDIGVSNFLVRHLEHLTKHSPVIPAVNQIQLHPFLMESATVEYCRTNNIVVQAYSPLARCDQRFLRNPTLTAIAKHHGKTVPQVALKWLLLQGFVVLPKSKHPDRIRQNIQLDFVMTEEEVKSITGLHEQQSFRTCWDPNTVTH